MKQHFILAFSILLLSTCQPSKGQNENSVTPSIAETPSQDIYTHVPTLETNLPKDIITIQDQWEQSPHAQTYDLSKGPNTYCARCHSPKNWDPSSRIDDPPNCLTCKFPFEDSTRSGKNNPLVPLNNWNNIRCDNCHEGMNDEVSSEISWWNQQTKQYEKVDDSTSLCEKCHTDTTVLKHQIDLGNSAHQTFTCTDCHDPHSTAANCTNSTCHADITQSTVFILSTPEGGHPNEGAPFCGGPNCHPAATAIANDPQAIHGHTHLRVNCVACHDADGLEVDQDPETGLWMTWQSTELYGVLNRKPYLSHNIQVEVDCIKCHFVDNFWDLPTISGSEFDDQSISN